MSLLRLLLYRPTTVPIQSDDCPNFLIIWSVRAAYRYGAKLGDEGAAQGSTGRPAEPADRKTLEEWNANFASRRIDILIGLVVLERVQL